MGLFGRSKIPSPDADLRIGNLESEVGRLRSAMRTLEGEQASMHDQVRRWMRRAVAAERRLDPEVVPRPGEQAPPAPPTLYETRKPLFGARARIAARRARHDPLDESDVVEHATAGEG